MKNGIPKTKTNPNPQLVQSVSAMSTAPGSASRQVRSTKKKGSSSRPPSSDHSQQKLRQSFTPIPSRAVMDKLEDKKDDHCCEHDVLLQGTKSEKPKIATSHTSKGTKAEKPKIAASQTSKGTKAEKSKIATSHTSKGTKVEKPNIATSHTSKGTKVEKPEIDTSQGNGPRPFRIIGGDPFVPGTDNYRRMVAQRLRLLEQGKNGNLFTVCEGDPCSPDNFLKSVAANCCGPHKRA